MKADKEGPSKLGLLFDKAQLKDGKEVPLTMALVSVAPHWEPGGVDPVAADNGAASAGRVTQMSQAAGRSDGSAGGDTLNKGLGVRGATSVSETAMRPGSVLFAGHDDCQLLDGRAGNHPAINQEHRVPRFRQPTPVAGSVECLGESPSFAELSPQTSPPNGTPRYRGVPFLMSCRLGSSWAHSWGGTNWCIVKLRVFERRVSSHPSFCTSDSCL